MIKGWKQNCMDLYMHGLIVQTVLQHHSQCSSAKRWYGIFSSISSIKKTCTQSIEMGRNIFYANPLAYYLSEILWNCKMQWDIPINFNLSHCVSNTFQYILYCESVSCIILGITSQCVDSFLITSVTQYFRQVYSSMLKSSGMTLSFGKKTEKLSE